MPTTAGMQQQSIVFRAFYLCTTRLDYAHIHGVDKCKPFLLARQYRNKIERSVTEHDSRKQVLAFWDRLTTIHKGSSTLTKMSK